MFKERIVRFLIAYRKHVPVPSLLTFGAVLWFIVLEHVFGLQTHIAVIIAIVGGLLTLSQLSSIVLSRRKCPKCGKKFNENENAILDVSNDTCANCGYKPE